MSKSKKPEWKKGKYIKTDELKNFKNDLEKVKKVLSTQLNDLKTSLEVLKPYTKKDYDKNWGKDK